MRDVLERQSLSEVKIGRGFPICERVHKKIVEYFKNNVPQCQIATALQILSSKCITSSKDSEKLEKSLCKGTRTKTFVGCLCSSGPQTSLHQNRHDSVIDITKWALEYFQKPLSVNTTRHAICKCQLKLYHAKGSHMWTWSRSAIVSYGPGLI